MTIFGYNTDIRHGNTVFHVQTEARPSELTMQSAIFVRGRCIGKHNVCYGDPDAPELTEDQIHQLVTQQHRFVVNTIREGRLDALLASEGEGNRAPVDETVPAATGAGEVETQLPVAALNGSASAQPEERLGLEWLAEGVVWDCDTARMRFRVTLGTRACAGARIITRVQCAGCEPLFGEGTSDAKGEAEVEHRMQMASSVPATGCTLLVKVSSGRQSLTRKFRLQPRPSESVSS